MPNTLTENQDVGYQGEPAAFSEGAVLGLFGNYVRPRGYIDFDALVRAVEEREIRYGLLPCENTIYGPIVRAYDLLLRYERVAIVDETSCKIVQCLVGAPGATLGDLGRVLSHPVALEQCRDFLKSMPHVSIEPVEDTAGAIRLIVERGDRGTGAIGPRIAAERYGGVLLAEEVQDESENFTRFLVISRDRLARRNLRRLCIAFSIPNRPGSLSRALARVGQEGFNVRSVVARPKLGHLFEYDFVVELERPELTDTFNIVLPGALNVRVLGNY